MKKKILLLTVVIAVTCWGYGALCLAGDFPEKGKDKKVLILYPRRVPEGAKYDAVSSLRNQIAHFNVRVVELQAAKYQSGMIDFYDVIFYLGLSEKEPPPEEFYRDVLEGKERTICWIYANIIPLMEQAGDSFGFRVGPREFGFNSISYRGYSFNRRGEDIFVITVNDRKKANPHGSLFREDEFVPLAVSSGNFWYFCDLPFFMDSSSAVFCDLLHNVFREQHQTYKFAMIRVEDIHPDRSPKNIRGIGRLFKKHDIPFSFGVIPVYTLPGRKKVIYLSDKPHLASALRYLQTVGGSAILHGYTHQYKDESGEGHEFWDMDGDRPRPDDSAKLVDEKLNKGLQECIQNGIYPLAWETPHYGASQLDYQVFSKIFSTGVERLQLSDQAFGASQSYPYFIESKNGRWIIPENLGYVSYREGATVERMLEGARKMLVVRDAVAVGFFHPYIELEHLEKLILGLKHMGYTFLDLRHIPNQVKGDNWQIFSGLPYFHGHRFISQVFYNWSLSPLRKIDLSDEYLYTYLLDKNFRKNDASVYSGPVNGEVMVQIPGQADNIFVVHKGDKPLAGWESFKRWFFDAFLGRETVSLTDTMIRLLMWVFFIITAGLLIVLVLIYVSFWITGRKKK